MELSVIIPAKNEEKRIGATLKKTIKFLKDNNYTYEIIVVDDGCTDNTSQVVNKFKKDNVMITKHRQNKGKGFSVRQGMFLAKYDHALFMDADNSTQVKEVEHFIPHLKDNHILIASRNLKESTIAVKQPWLRSTLGKGFPLLVRLFAVRGIKDTQCGFKLFNKKAIKEVFTRSRLDRWGFDVELLFIAKKQKLNIRELPITWTNDGQSKVNPFKDSIDMAWDILRIRWNSLRGVYE